MNVHLIKKLHKGFTFSGLQGSIEAILNNPQSRIEWASRLISTTKKLCRQVRKADLVPEPIIVEAIFLVVVYANYRQINIQEWVTRRYPGFCIYCENKICSCTHPGISRALFPCDVTQIKPDMKLSVRQFQVRDFGVYPNNKSHEAKVVRGLHLFEELGELAVEVLNESAGQSDILKITEEVVDVLERLISLASALDINIETLILKHKS